MSVEKPLESERDQKAAIPGDILRVGIRFHHPDVCECDLWPDGDGDPECKISPRLEPLDKWIMRLIEEVKSVRAERDQAQREADARESRWAADFRRMEGRLAKFLDRAEKAEAERDQLRTERDAAWDAGKLLLESHCCDTGEVDYQTEWLDDSTTVCDVCCPFRSLARPIPAEPEGK